MGECEKTKKIKVESVYLIEDTMFFYDLDDLALELIVEMCLYANPDWKEQYYQLCMVSQRFLSFAQSWLRLKARELMDLRSCCLKFINKNFIEDHKLVIWTLDVNPGKFQQYIPILSTYAENGINWFESTVTGTKIEYSAENEVIIYEEVLDTLVRDPTSKFFCYPCKHCMTRKFGYMEFMSMNEWILFPLTPYYKALKILNGVFVDRDLLKFCKPITYNEKAIKNIVAVVLAWEVAGLISIFIEDYEYGRYQFFLMLSCGLDAIFRDVNSNVDHGMKMSICRTFDKSSYYQHIRDLESSGSESDSDSDSDSDVGSRSHQPKPYFFYYISNDTLYSMREFFFNARNEV